MWYRTTGICLVLSLILAKIVVADTISLNPIKDNTLIQTSAGNLSNGLGDIYVGRTNQDGQGPATTSIRRGLIEFDIAGNIPAGATITGATLTLNEVQGLNGNQTVSLHALLQDWGQGTSYFSGGQGAPATNNDATWLYTFYNAANPSASPTWTTPGGSYSPIVSATSLITQGSPNQLFTWSSANNPQMLADVQGWLDHPATDFGWIMLGNESQGQTAKQFSSSESTTPGFWPTLTVSYSAVPEPGTAVLAAAGALGLAAVGFVRRRNRAIGHRRSNSAS